jgi:pyrrolysine biosynthesis protein PylD
MTRLREEDISHVTCTLRQYDNELFNKLGHHLPQIAAYAVGKKQEDFYALRDSMIIAVVPVSCGQGIINGFSESVQRIIEFMGFTAFVTAASDVGGVAEAASQGAKVIFLADDDRFIAINMATGQVADNGEATGKGYAAALDLLAGGIHGKEVLILGAGPVGQSTAAWMAAHGAKLFVYDINRKHADRLVSRVPDVQIVTDLQEALAKYRLVIEATPAADVIGKQCITKKTMISAPGIPLGISQEALALVLDRLIHDVLEIGTATMLFSVLTNEAIGAI